MDVAANAIPASHRRNAYARLFGRSRICWSNVEEIRWLEDKLGSALEDALYDVRPQITARTAQHSGATMPVVSPHSASFPRTQSMKPRSDKRAAHHQRSQESGAGCHGLISVAGGQPLGRPPGHSYPGPRVARCGRSTSSHAGAGSGLGCTILGAIPLRASASRYNLA
ncbi:hypothetical protein HaLaN_10457 [Haematococcus lacustris]|uniref:Uncharacterized protein n=1 Tax=Haematococcus lacustris TaxID=44745 RepID=A0A699Z4X8_HAELA|nr:hypothetical protein HaLaN_10457 [Haematococcus lacustris]